MAQKKCIYDGGRIRKARFKAGIGTQRELAERTGISPTIISDLERGRRRLSPAWACRIAEQTGTEAVWLLQEEPDGEGVERRIVLYRRRRAKRQR